MPVSPQGYCLPHRRVLGAFAPIKSHSPARLRARGLCIQPWFLPACPWLYRQANRCRRDTLDACHIAVQLSCHVGLKTQGVTLNLRSPSFRRSSKSGNFGRGASWEVLDYHRSRFRQDFQDLDGK